MSDELKELNHRLELDMVAAQKDGNEDVVAGLQAAMWEVFNLDKPYNFYHKEVTDDD